MAISENMKLYLNWRRYRRPNRQVTASVQQLVSKIWWKRKEPYTYLNQKIANKTENSTAYPKNINMMVAIAKIES